MSIKSSFFALKNVIFNSKTHRALEYRVYLRDIRGLKVLRGRVGHIEVLLPRELAADCQLPRVQDACASIIDLISRKNTVENSRKTVKMNGESHRR